MLKNKAPPIHMPLYVLHQMVNRDTIKISFVILLDLWFVEAQWLKIVRTVSRLKHLSQKLKAVYGITRCFSHSVHHLKTASGVPAPAI